MNEWYEIRVKGQVGPGWAAWLDGMTLSPDRDATTVLSRPVGGHAAP